MGKGEAYLGTRGRGKCVLEIHGAEVEGFAEYSGSRPIETLQPNAAQEAQRLATEEQ
jgi:hypothetical protein